MTYQYISSLSNSKIKQVIKLFNSRSYRYETNLAVIYGEHLIEEAIKHNILDCVFLNEKSIYKYNELIKDINYKHVYLLNDAISNKINFSDSATDILGLIYIKQHEFNEDNYLHSDCVVLENIQDPGNLGTIFRTCNASGVHNVFLSASCVDPYNTKVLRASQGVQFGLNVIVLNDIYDFVKNYKAQVIATTPKSSLSIYNQDLVKSCAWIFGNEGAGLSKEILALTDCQLGIPMKGTIESLNVAMAATICLFEMQRQRMILEN